LSLDTVHNCYFC